MYVKYTIHDVMGGMGFDMKDGIHKFDQIWTKHLTLPETNIAPENGGFQ